MQYFDKHGNEIKAGMFLRMEDGSIEEIYACTDSYGKEDLGINASNDEYLKRHGSVSYTHLLCLFIHTFRGREHP